MRCYTHGADARGVCSICGRGVCESCVVEVGNRLSCGRPECQSQAGIMRSWTVGSARTDLIFGAMGLLFVVFGVVGIVALDAWFLLFMVGIGAGLIALGLLVRRSRA